jgi:predicted ferric reductase
MFNLVIPVNESLLSQYQKLKKSLRKKVEKLLLIRHSFNKNMIADILTTATTVHDDAEEKGPLNAYVDVEANMKIGKFSLKAEIKRPYWQIFLIILLWTFVAFSWMAIGSSQSSYSKFIGPLVIGSKGCAAALLMACSFMMISVSYDLLSYFRAKWRKKCLAWLDHNIVIHRFWGYVITIYAVVHSACHLMGSIKTISESEPEEIKSHFHNYEFDEKISYTHVLFGSLTGLTGVILLVVILAMAVTSLKWVRRRWFQLFGYVHMTLFPIFFIWLMIHGWGFWLNWGVPFAVIFILPGFVMLMIQEIVRLFSFWRYKFKIADVSITPDKKFMLIHFIRPKNYKLKHGQFCFLNVPSVHPLQWHPFTIASSPSSPYLVLMIKRNGDWTRKLINKFYECKKNSMRYKELAIYNYEEFDVFNLLHDIHQELSIKQTKDRNQLFYPLVNISNPCPTPWETFMERKNLILVGAGSGIAPFLPFLEEAIRLEQGKSNVLSQSKYCQSCFLIFVAREGEQISWVSNYLFHMLKSECVIPQFEFYIYITMNKNWETLPSFLFWRALLLIGFTNRLCFRRKGSGRATSVLAKITEEEILETGPIKIRFGRPDFLKLFQDNIQKFDKKWYAYACKKISTPFINVLGTTPKLNNHLYKIFHHLNQTTDVKFSYTVEELS